MNRYVSLYYELRDGSARWVAAEAPNPREAQKATGLHRQHDLHVETWRIDRLAEQAASALNGVPEGQGRPYVVIYQDFDGELHFSPARAANGLDAATQFDDEGLIVEAVYAEDLKSQVERFQSATPEEIARELAFDQGVAARRLLEAREPMSLSSLITRMPSLER